MFGTRILIGLLTAASASFQEDDDAFEETLDSLINPCVIDDAADYRTLFKGFGHSGTSHTGLMGLMCVSVHTHSHVSEVNAFILCVSTPASCVAAAFILASQTNCAHLNPIRLVT